LIDKDKGHRLHRRDRHRRRSSPAPIAQAKGIPMITPASTHQLITAAGNFVFRACYTDSFQAAVMAKFARSCELETGRPLSIKAMLRVRPRRWSGEFRHDGGLEGIGVPSEAEIGPPR